MASGSVFADDSESSQASTDEPAQLSHSEEETENSSELEPDSVPKKAENIDLKDVVSEPLLPAATPLPEPTPEASPEPTSTPVLTYDDIIESPEETPTQTPEAAVAHDETPKPGLLSKIAQELTPTVTQEPLVLLNSEVPPGTSTRLGWSPSVSFMGISAPTAVLVLNGVKKGPTLCLTAAVHGDELNGIEIVRRVMYNIDPQVLTGAVIGVPIVNVQGFRRSSRYLPDRRDLNRFFPGNPDGSSAARIAHSFFTEVITHCDMMVDLHTGSFRRTNLPQLRADLNYPEVADLANKMGAIVVVQSEGAVGSLRRSAVEHGIPTVTLEAGAPHELQKNAVEHGVKSIESAMDSLGMIKRRRFWERAAEPVYYRSTWVRAREGGILFSEIALGDFVKKDDLLGTVTDPITNMRTEIRAPFEGRVIGMALNQVMFPGFAAYHIGLKAPAVEKAVEPMPVEELVEAQPAAEAGVAENESAAMQVDQAPNIETPSEPALIEETGEADMIAPIEDSE